MGDKGPIDPALDLDKAERQAVDRLDPELRKHGLLSQRAYNLIGAVVARIPESPLRDVRQSRKVAISLLVRVQNDLRCASLLALRGYPDQACTLVASIYEAAMTIGVVGSDDRVAQEWIEHDDPNKPFRSTQKMTRDALERLRAPEPEKNAERNYTIYRQLCMVKHLNPLLLSERGYEVVGNAISIGGGPDTSEAGVRIAQFALEKGIGFAFTAMAIFVKEHLNSVETDNLIQQLRELNRDVMTLNEEAAKRWGTENPYPEKWKI
jgi:hypothetical protein